MTIPDFSGWLQHAARNADSLRVSLHSLRADLATTRDSLAETEQAAESLASASVGSVRSDERADRRHGGRQSGLSEGLQKILEASQIEGEAGPLDFKRAFELVQEEIAAQDRAKHQTNAFARAEDIRGSQGRADYFERVFGQLGDLKRLADELREYMRLSESRATRGDATGTTSGAIGTAKPRARKQTSIAILRWGGELR